jgi:hypothetical protein
MVVDLFIQLGLDALKQVMVLSSFFAAGGNVLRREGQTPDKNWRMSISRMSWADYQRLNC